MRRGPVEMKKWGAMAEPNILLTGKPRAGKTTLMERVVERLRREAPGLRLAGFTTAELRDAAGERSGFAIVTLGGERATLARAGLESRVRVGRYGVDLEAFERLALPELARRDADLMIVDEIGKMECASGRFRRAVEDALDAPVAVLATLGISGVPFFQALRERPDVEVITVMPRNRDALVDELCARLRAVPG